MILYYTLLYLTGVGIGWGLRGLYFHSKLLKCKTCGWKSLTPLHYCPWCGSKEGFEMKVNK